MKNQNPLSRKLLILPVIFLFVISCSIFGTPEKEETEAPAAPETSPTATPTPTAVPQISESEEPADSRCKGLSGSIEIRVKVGPAEAVGLEPFAVGSAPFSVNGDEPPYTLQGGGPISYYALLEEQWGTYEVTFEMDTAITGECSGESGSESLSIALEADGSQNVIVDAEGFHGEYPWAGSHTFNLEFPLEEGASIEGEGYIFILHLGQ